MCRVPRRERAAKSIPRVKTPSEKNSENQYNFGCVFDTVFFRSPHETLFLKTEVGFLTLLFLLHSISAYGNCVFFSSSFFLFFWQISGTMTAGNGPASQAVGDRAPKREKAKRRKRKKAKKENAQKPTERNEPQPPQQADDIFANEWRPVVSAAAVRTKGVEADVADVDTQVAAL
jgi:hypothetical protein